jgi:hypothetical protein
MERLFFYDTCRRIAFFFCICFSTALFSSSYAQYNTEIRTCYNLIIDLKIDEATQKIAYLKQTQKDNIAIVHMENYIDFFVLFITESKAEYSKRISHKDNRIEYLNTLKINDPHLAFIKAEILLQWALIQLKFDEKLKAGSNVYEAYNLLESNKAAFPKFIENNKSLSIIHALAESVPKWVRKIIGVKGSIALGKDEIEKLSLYAYNDKNYFFREEVATINSYILFYQLNQKNKAITELDKFKLDHKSSPLIAFLKASMYLRNGSNDQCLQIIEEYNPSNGQLPFYYLDFMKGRSLLYKLDENAVRYLKIFVDNFKGRHFIKEAYQKLAWYELSINNNVTKYKQYMALCNTKGNDLVDEDQQASKEAQSNKIPNVSLLKARILYDGGYYSKSQQTLIKNAHNLQEVSSTQLEFNYRMARVLQALKNYPDAINYFKITLNLGAKTHEYFSASAALQLGFIFEDQKQKQNAKYYFEKCLNMNPTEYKNSIHQKAKSGLQRLSN